jgi:hypothetical protein
MDISYERLVSSGCVWRDGLHWLEELEAWSLGYEEESMGAAEANNRLARATLDAALFNVPRFLRGFGERFMVSILEPRIRKALVYFYASLFRGNCTNAVIQARRSPRDDT